MPPSRPSRRSFLALTGAAGLAGPLALAGARPVAAAPNHRVHRWESEPGPATLELAIYRPPHPFNAVGVLWQGPDDALAVRVSKQGRWTEWQPVHAHPGEGRTVSSPWRSGTLLAFATSSEIQYRLLKPGVSRVRCQLIDTAEGPTAPVRIALGATVISRAQWGCDERLRFDGGEERWPVEYAPVEKVIVHHTVSANEEADPAATVRSIYVYHATQVDGGGWGDIGYNLLVDWKGNIYEGRFGGPGVIGGHARGYNTGSVGVGFLGTFSNSYIPMAAEGAFASVIASSFGFLDPFGSGFFADRTLPNICGHRDCGSTECPGNFGYKQLANLRDAVARWRGAPRPQAQLLYARFTSLVQAQDVVQLAIEVWNNSSARLDTQGPDPDFVYDENQNSATVGHPGQNNRWRVGIDFADNSTGRIYPFRWGLGGSMEPGERRVITGQVELILPKRSTWWAGLVQEGVAYRTDLFGVMRPVLTTPSQVFVPLANRNAAEPDDQSMVRQPTAGRPS